MSAPSILIKRNFQQQLVILVLHVQGLVIVCYKYGFVKYCT